MKQSTRFRHESIQDRRTIRSLLDALSEGLEKGSVTLEDSSGVLALSPAELMVLKISADQDDDKSRITLRITWTEDSDIPHRKPVTISSG